MSTEIFVFGSNLAGRHGKGAALGSGLQGFSYAIPTKDARLRTPPLDEIRLHVMIFGAFAREHPCFFFRLTPIGCGLAGYKPEQIGPMFKCAPSNVILPPEFEPFARPILDAAMKPQEPSND